MDYSCPIDWSDSASTTAGTLSLRHIEQGEAKLKNEKNTPNVRTFEIPHLLSSTRNSLAMLGSARSGPGEVNVQGD